ncbi:MAG: hypothetical protein M1830_002479 [Pleopsidium flavum]|nr:MAG: hypothetical protein M1830_002479 [Pleopsidium flavum]
MTADRNSLALCPLTKVEALHSNYPKFTAHAPSATESVMLRLPPGPTEAEQDEQAEGEEEMAPSRAEFEGISDGASTKTAWEGRVDKRKTNRFRLTHSQTRYLMSEFARQAHPDVAQRERLSREIPGLSPRQVQVWFQNRRAKLKRLTSDDRDRTTRSRALPDDFDMTNAFHPFSNGSQSSGSPTGTSVIHSSTFTDNESNGRSMFDALSLQSEDDNVISPVSIGSTFNNFFTPPGSCSASDGLSPLSTTSDSPHFNAFPISEVTSPESVTPFIRAKNFSTAYSYHTHTPPMPLHEAKPRSRGEMLVSPFRPSLAYTHSAEGYGDFQPTSSSAYNMKHQPRSDMESSRTHHGVGYLNGSIQDVPLSSLAPAGSTSMDPSLVSQLSSYHGLQQNLSSHPAPLPRDLQNETQWSNQLDAPYHRGSINAHSSTFYEIREPLAQDWTPGVEQNVARTAFHYESDTRWQQHLSNNCNIHSGSTDPYPT